MRYLKILSLVLLSLVVMTACNKDKKNTKGVVGEWHLISWNEEAPEFDVYISFAEDGSFEIYQQVWSFDYELFTGTYSVKGDTLKGSYSDGSAWAMEYKFAKTDKTLTLTDTANVNGVYESCTIPEEIISEATTTRSAEVIPFL